MDHAESRVAVSYAVHDDTHGQEIVNMLHGAALSLHLLVERIDMLDAPFDGGLDPGLAQFLLEQTDHPLEIAIPRGLGLLEHICKLVVALGVQVRERDVLKLAFHTPHTKAVGEW